MGPHLVICALIVRGRVVSMISNVEAQIVDADEALSGSSVSDCRIECSCFEFVDLPTQLLNERISSRYLTASSKTREVMNSPKALSRTCR